MTSRYEDFDGARVALSLGVNLVEASAGTGKTYALTMLVVRAVVELGLPIDRILIVTFTKAATEELKSRIRSRLVEARELLGAGPERHSSVADPTVRQWLAGLREPEVATSRLQLALYDIDRAPIFTIHGFCQRMLAEQALESGQLFEMELVADIDQVRREVAEDFWRRHIYPLAPAPCGVVTAEFASPRELLASVSAVLRPGIRVEPQVEPIEMAAAAYSAALAAMVRWWSQHGGALDRRFVQAREDGMFKESFARGLALELAQASQCFGGQGRQLPDLVLLDRVALADQLHGSRLRGEAKRRQYLADWPLPDQELAQLRQAIDQLLLSVRTSLAADLRREVSRRLDHQGTLGFDDLISRLSGALRGEPGRALRQLLANRFTMALIDEFQDTDGSQWHIFSTLFGTGQHYLYLIGDPKQAIYRFRGADINSYFLARERADRILNLGHNYRSHPGLVEEVNRLFANHRPARPGGNELLEYRRVEPALDSARLGLMRGVEELAGMVYCCLTPAPQGRDGRWTSGRAADQYRRFVVAELDRLLDPNLPVLLRQAESRQLAPKDIAILVRTNRQAEEYREALTEAGIPAVVASRQSVFTTEQSREMLMVLLAIEVPADGGRLKSAMATPWFGLTGDQLHDLWQAEEEVSKVHSRFYQYHRDWQEQGFLTMWLKLVVEERVLVNLARHPMAERAIANLNQLALLLQEQEAMENLGPAQLIQWLRRRMQDEGSSEDAELLLESDREAVQLVTMHSAKGLEYPVVFCPYLWYHRDRLSGERYQVACHGQEGENLVDLGSDQFARRRDLAEQEVVAEELRLLYVALTRARLRCYICWADVMAHAPVADSFRSALGQLLFPHGWTDHSGQQRRFEALTTEPFVQLAIVPDEMAPVGYRAVVPLPQLQPLAETGRSLTTEWQLSSFTALAQLGDYDHEALPPSGDVTGASEPVAVIGLPAGAHFGNLVHHCLETLSFAAIGRPDLREAQVETVRHSCIRHGVEVDPERVLDLLVQVVSTPLTAEGFRLERVDDRCCLKEMAFYFRLGRLETERLNAILAGEPGFAALGPKAMQGYLTGFVDLICRVDGQYYILDYKTNQLGESLFDYQPERLAAAMQEHNYGLQYWLYTLALHRHLGTLLPGYRYEHHFGGVRYLFVRGMVSTVPGSGVFAARPDITILKRLDQAIGRRDDE